MSVPNPPAAKAPGSALQRPHILAVTDDEGLKAFLVDGLVAGGFWLSVVASAIQTLEVLRLRSFDLLLVDEQLSGLSAHELIRRIRGRTSGALPEDAPILLMSERDDATLAPADAEVGIAQVLIPPIDLEDLVPLLHHHVLTWRAQHPGVPWADEVAQLRPNENDQPDSPSP